MRQILQQVADKNPLSLDEPAPLFIFNGFADSSLSIQFSVWTKRENFRDLRNSIQEEVKIAFDQAGIEIPFPQRTVVFGKGSAPVTINTAADTKPSAEQKD